MLYTGNHEIQPTRGTKRRRDEEQIIKQKSQMKPLVHKRRRAPKEQLLSNGQ